MPRLITAAALLGLLAIAGCGGGGGGGGGPEPGSVPEDQAFMPLAVGNKWVYEYRAPQINTEQGDEPLPDRSTRTIVGTTVIDDKEWYEMEMVEWAEELGEDHPIDVLHQWVRETTDGVYLWNATLRKPILWLRKPPTADDHWSGVGAYGDGHDWFVQALEDTITVPFGTLDHCVRVLEREPLDPDAGVRHEWLRWFKKGVGMVAEQYWHIPNDPDGPWDETALIECTLK